jgi:2-dehydro-3-deoxygluconokinase
MPFDVLTLGETLIALDAAEPGRIESVRMLRKTVGGTESNTAIGLARLGCRVAWVSRVARDPFGEEILKVLRGEGVDVGAVVRVDDAPTGLMIKERRTPTEVHVHYWRRGSAAAGLGPEDVDERLVAEARRVHLTGITLALGERPRAAVHKVLRCCAERGIPVSFDPNLRRKLRPVQESVADCREVFPFVTDLLVGEREALACSGEASIPAAIECLRGFGIPAVVVKRGGLGAVGARDSGGSGGLKSEAGTQAAGGHAQPSGSPPVNQELVEEPADAAVVAVDAVGSGDAFNAGYLFGQLRELGFRESVALGNWVAARVAGHPGDYEGLPTLAEYEAHRDGTGTITR